MTSNTTVPRLRTIAALLFSALLLAACGGEDPVPLTAAPEAATDDTVEEVVEAPAEESAASTTVSATIGQSDLGEILVGNNGLTLYGFTNDVDAASTCNGTCAEAWPPVIVDADFAVAPGLDVGIFATTERDDGSLQLVAGRWPLYFFAGDAVPGDVAGQGSGDVWFAVDLEGTLITDDSAAESTGEASASAALASVGETSLGETLVNADGLTLYGFTTDADGVPTCADACADAWPPILLASAELPEGLDPEVFSVVEGVVDGTFQLKAGAWPLYLFAGDAAPGDVNGQGSGDVWFAVNPTGGLIGAEGAVDASSDESGDDSADY